MSIEVKNLKYVYSPGMPGETTAIEDISFRIEDGEICGIIGHTGSGKSTLLQHLNGLLKPTEGEVYINDVCITDGSVKLVEVRSKVGLVFQYPEYQLFEETVAKDVAFGPRNLKLSEEEIEERVKKALTLVGLDYDEIGERSPFELSGGQKRRVAIAGIIAMNPEVLILDEPTAGLDPGAHNDVLKMIEKIHEEMGIIVIFVSHNMADIARLADKIIVINNGKIMMQGTAEEVFSHRNELAEVGLGVPPAMDIIMKLSEEFPEINGYKLTPDQAADELARVIGTAKN